MITCAAIIYTSLIILIYKILKIKPRATNVAAMVVLGVFMVGTIVIFWNYASPMTKNVVVTRYVIPIVPQVSGPIERIVATPNVPLKKDEDVLFEIQKDPYMMAAKQAQAALQSAVARVSQLEFGVQAATASIRKAEANLAAAKAALDVAMETQRLSPDAISELKVKQLQSQLGAAVAGLEQARAGQHQAEMALKSAQESTVGVESQLKLAKFNLSKCTVYAPADGFVTNWQARRGTMTSIKPLAAVGTFVDTSTTSLVASFPQNVVANVKPGDKVEFAIKSRPAEIVTGTVIDVIQATGEGQFSASANLISASSIGSKGKFAVKFKLDDADIASSLPMGSAGSVAIYTDTGKPFHPISKVTIRMNTWMNYLIPM